MESVIAAGTFALLGTIVGGVASFLGTYFVSRSSAIRERERVRLELRGRLLGLFIESMLAVAEVMPPWTGNKEAQGEARIQRRAQIDLSLVLVEGERPVHDFINGLVRAVASAADTNTRRGTVEQGGQMLIDWHVGLLPLEQLKPFKFHSYGPTGELLVEALPSW